MTIHLNIPNVVEVKWEIGEGMHVWWEADVRVFKTRNSGSRNEAAANLRYIAGHGFPLTRSKAVFLSNTILKQRMNGREVLLSWRPRQLSQRQKKKGKGHTSSLSKDLGTMHDEIMALRAKVAENALDLEKLRKERELISSTMQRPISNEIEKTAVLMSFLRHRLALQLQKPPRRNRSRGGEENEHLAEYTGGVRRGYIRAVADCDLGLFETFARSVKASSSGSDVIHYFDPPYLLTQTPRQGSEVFKIHVAGFSDICRIIDVESTADRLALVQKYSISREEGVMRILGAYSCDHNENDNASAELHVAHCCGYAECERENEEPYMGRTYPVLKRDSQQWNVEDQRYVHPLHLMKGTVAPLLPSGENRERPLTFHFKWKRAADARPRIWSRSITHPKSIVGRLEVMLPYVLIEGSVLCDEFTSLLTESALIEAVK